MENPKSFKFFGPQLSQTRAMDSIFESVKNSDTLYHRFKRYYDEFKGDVNACVALYNAYLYKDQKKSEDKWISTCANFLQMSYDFIEFVTAYRVGDAISIDVGYQKHAPVWEALNQNKYIDIFYKQQESLYRAITFAMMQEIRFNIFVRRYHGNTGKLCVAHDEFLKHSNRFSPNLSLSKTLSSFVFQSNCVGIGLMCKQQTDLWCSTVWK